MNSYIDSFNHEWLFFGPAAFPEGDPPPVWLLPRQADPQGLSNQIQPQEDEEVWDLLSYDVTEIQTWTNLLKKETPIIEPDKSNK